MSWFSKRPTSPGPDMSWQRFNDNLAPVVQAELARGNVLLPPGRWQETEGPGGRGERMYELRFRYVLDTDAIQAQFVLPAEMETRGGALVWGNISYHVIDGDRAAEGDRDAARTAAVSAWWQTWEAGPQSRTTIAPLPSFAGPVPVDVRPTDGDG